MDTLKVQDVDRPGLAAAMEAKGVPAVSVAVIENDRIVDAEAFGTPEVGSGRKVDPDTLFQAASISKPVFAYGVLKLVQAGRLSLDEDVNRRLKGWKVPESDLTKNHPVTLRRLLSHSAGTTVHGFGGYEAGAPLPTLAQILAGQPPASSPAVKVDAMPGTRWNYSGGGMEIAQLLVEETTRKPLVDYMRSAVLRPLGMKSSTYAQPLPAELLSKVALPYRRNLMPVKGGPHVYPEQAAAGLWTTPSDLAHFLIGLGESVRGDAPRPLGPKLAVEMTSNQSPTLDRPFGLGIALEGSGSHKAWLHDGANEGYRCLMIYLPALRKGAVVMTNGDEGSPIAEAAVAAIQKTYGW